ncbi:hypothetical protein JCGZ_08959 [Jatropha curcas]|uniref:Uncharacterized protein n=1 Tax=Jatropha curcas TaxID=180498 RepID=A0A067KH04_JATCU|nr:hypothetical protein JCGZ_08959 [Jatropha curcas]
MEEEYGWGIGSTIGLLGVAFFLLLAPLGMSSLHPPSPLLLLLLAITLLGILYFLHQASK